MYARKHRVGCFNIHVWQSHDMCIYYLLESFTSPWNSRRVDFIKAELLDTKAILTRFPLSHHTDACSIIKVVLGDNWDPSICCYPTPRISTLILHEKWWAGHRMKTAWEPTARLKVFDSIKYSPARCPI